MLKAASYCAYQERCYAEVEAKLSEWGIFGTDAGEIMIKLAEQNYLNEERFAKAFAGGKFRTKHWGRTRIIRELKFRKVSDYCIQKALKEIDEEDYRKTLLDLAQQKIDQTKGSKPVVKQKTAVYLIGKGYESDLVWKALTTLIP